MNAATVTLVVALIGAAVALVMTRRRARHDAREYLRLGRMLAPRSELSEALALRDGLMNAVSSPVLVFGAEGSVIRANAVTRSQMPDLATKVPPELAAAVAACRATGRPQTLEITLYEPERRRFHADLRPFTSAAGQACVAVLTDTSKQDDYRDARRLFSAGVSHELRTPLARILALVDTLALPLTDAERAAMIDQARAEVDAMRQLIEDMILLVRLESHELTGIAESTDVTAAVDSCTERHAPAAADRGMTITGEAPGGLVVAVAPRLLDVVLDNLVTNAITHAGVGSLIEIRARGLAGAVELVVADDGVGIPAEHVPRIFERFYRVEDARSGPGTGLGLAIVKHIAEEYGGRATAESAPGDGTTMRVVLPAPAVAEAKARAAEEAAG
jgi:signal transduction histidine kinase